MQGRAIAPVTRGCTSEGPGPIRVRTGGLNEVIAMGFILSRILKVGYCAMIGSVGLRVQTRVLFMSYFKWSYSMATKTDQRKKPQICQYLVLTHYCCYAEI